MLNGTLLNSAEHFTPKIWQHMLKQAILKLARNLLHINYDTAAMAGLLTGILFGKYIIPAMGDACMFHR